MLEAVVLGVEADEPVVADAPLEPVLSEGCSSVAQPSVAMDAMTIEAATEATAKMPGRVRERAMLR